MKKNSIVVYLLLCFIFSEKIMSQQAEEYIVKKGDNLWRIAHIYQATEKEIMELNNMTSNKIKPGQILLIPREKKFSMIISSSQIKENRAKDVEKDVGKNTLEDLANQDILEQNKENFTRHKVLQGESLWDISRKYKTSLDEIKIANNLSGNLIKPGETLIIPKKTDIFSEFKNIKPLPDINKLDFENLQNISLQDSLQNKENFTRHKVLQGESLWDISRKYKTSLDEIKIANNLSGNLIRPGELLYVPAREMSNFKNKSTFKKMVSVNKIVDQKDKNIEKRIGKERKEDAVDEDKLDEIKEERSKIVALASRYIGVRYRWGGTHPSGFDCSGFVRYVYSQIGENLPRSSREQFNVGIPVEKSELKPGDRVFFSTYRKGPSHVGIYIGGGKFIHASSKRGSRYVRIDDIDSPFYRKRYIGARRPYERSSD